MLEESLGDEQGGKGRGEMDERTGVGQSCSSAACMCNVRLASASAARPDIVAVNVTSGPAKN